MKTKFYLNNKKITKKALQEMLSKEIIDRMIKESKEMFREDPLIENGYFLGSIGNLVIKFE